MSGEKNFNPSIAFLRKVEAQDMRLVFGYSARGGYWKFYGGEKTANAHREAGFVKPWGGATLGRPAYVELTDKGREAISKSSGAAS